MIILIIIILNSFFMNCFTKYMFALGLLFFVNTVNANICNGLINSKFKQVTMNKVLGEIIASSNNYRIVDSAEIITQMVDLTLTTNFISSFKGPGAIRNFFDPSVRVAFEGKVEKLSGHLEYLNSRLKAELFVLTNTLTPLNARINFLVTLPSHFANKKQREYLKELRMQQRNMHRSISRLIEKITDITGVDFKNSFDVAYKRYERSLGKDSINIATNDTKRMIHQVEMLEYRGVVLTEEVKAKTFQAIAQHRDNFIL